MRLFSIEVAAVGLLATWWMGIPTGMILGLTGLIHKDWKTMFRVTFKTFIVTILIAFATGLTGLAYGHFHLAHKPKSEFKNWRIPDNLIDFESFIKAGSMHNFSYLGGLTGLIGGLIYTFVQKRKLQANENEQIQCKKRLVHDFEHICSKRDFVPDLKPRFCNENSMTF